MSGGSLGDLGKTPNIVLTAVTAKDKPKKKKKSRAANLTTKYGELVDEPRTKEKSPQ